MTPRWLLPIVLARRELRGGIRGFRIFLACLTLGVAAIATVQSLSSGILQGLREDGMKEHDVAKGRETNNSKVALSPGRHKERDWFRDRCRA